MHYFPTISLSFILFDKLALSGSSSSIFRTPGEFRIYIAIQYVQLFRWCSGEDTAFSGIELNIHPSLSVSPSVLYYLSSPHFIAYMKSRILWGEEVDIPSVDLKMFIHFIMRRMYILRMYEYGINGESTFIVCSCELM